MDRGSFLRRATVAGLALAGLRLPAPDAELVDGGTVELRVARDSILNVTNDFQIFGEPLTASGGICAPVTPYYALVKVSEQLPTFRAERGGITYRRPEDA